ncbi:MAG: ABC transporter substrate-binding protein, partial [Opitutaceae bacterium]|nr:ABC transporter substrate-binding protein [Opitutaceae bacterium]
MTRPRFLPALFLGLTCAALAAEGPLKIGHYASLTGKDAAFGVATRKGVILAVEEINAKGGVLGRKLEYHVEDMQSKQGEAATAVKKLISREKVGVMIGANASANSREAAPICQNAKVPMMAISSTNPRVTEIGGAAVNGAYYCSHYSSESTAPEVRDFVQRFRAKYRDTP